MVKGAILRQGRQLLFVALTVALGISLATAMLNVMFDVGEKVNQELKAFGANITVTSKNSSILKDIYGLDDESAPKEYLKESDLGQIKTIFWTNNIVALSPHLNGHVTLDNGVSVPVSGTWFDHKMDLPTGEVFVTGEQYLKSWWQLDGEWPEEKEENSVLVGKDLAASLHVKRETPFPILIRMEQKVHLPFQAFLPAAVKKTVKLSRIFRLCRKLSVWKERWIPSLSAP